MTKTIFVVGLDGFTGSFLETLRDVEECEFRALLAFEEAVTPPRDIRFNGLLEIAEERLAAFERDSENELGGIIGWWDFPTCALVPTLRRRHGLPAPSLTAIAACEHKYFARKEQAKVVPDMTPNFAAVDPFAEDPKRVEIAYPFWLKPVVGHSSFLGFYIGDEADFDEALAVIRREIEHLRQPVDHFLEQAGWPDGTDNVSGDHLIAEEIISEGEQCTLEGYVYEGEPHVFGIIDTQRSGRHRSTLSSYRYPSTMPERVQARMCEAVGKVMRQIGFDNGAFNVEFYWYERDDSLKLLEINTRISKSHSPLFRIVDGVSNQQVLVDLTRGRRPNMPHREGDHPMATKFMLRLSRERMEDAVVTRVPTQADIDRLREEFPEAHLQVLVQEGDRLSDLPYQESYSYELADLFLGAHDEEEMERKYRRCQELLPFEFDPREAPA